MNRLQPGVYTNASFPCPVTLVSNNLLSSSDQRLFNDLFAVSDYMTARFLDLKLAAIIEKGLPPETDLQSVISSAVVIIRMDRFFKAKPLVAEVTKAIEAHYTEYMKPFVWESSILTLFPSSVFTVSNE